MSHEEIMRELSAYAPDVIGLYSTTFGWEKAVFTAEANKGKAFASMSGCRTGIDKKDDCFIIHLTGSPCCT